MKKRQVRLLVEEAKAFGVNMSKDRQYNPAGDNHETFHVDKIVALTDTTASVLYKKEPTKKLSLGFFYWRKNVRKQPDGSWKDGWLRFMPTENHAMGMAQILSHLLRMNELNANIDIETEGLLK